MKMNFKENKGITLVALIITIIVLLILAVVTISAVKEGDLFTHAENAANKYKDEAILENTIISNGLTKIKKYDGETTGNSISGTYNFYIGAEDTISSIVLNDNSNVKLVAMGMEMNGTYTYSEENNEILVTVNGMTMPFELYKTANNKVIKLYNEGNAFLTTNGGTDIIPLTNKTYSGNDGESNRTFVFGEGNIGGKNLGTVEENGNNYIYCIVNNNLYLFTPEMGSELTGGTINSDYLVITIEENNYEIQE